MPGRTDSNKENGPSKPVFQIKMEKDVYIPLRDGVRVAADIYRPDAKGKFPALLGAGPYGKELESLAMSFPPQQRPSPLWDGCIEAGDINYIVPRGYAHVIVDMRGTGASEGEFSGFMGVGADWEGKDCYDIIEWIAKQPWCDGNVGMVGVSYFASVQVLAAAEQPPHLKAIFANGGHYDGYEFGYHGGIMWLMPRAAYEGRAGDSGVAVKNVKSVMMKKLSRQEFKRRVQERLNDPDIRNYPNLYHMLHYPDSHPLFIDLVLNPHDGPFYQEGKGLLKGDKVKVPSYLGIKWGRGWTVDGTIDTYLGIEGPKKLELQPFPPLQDRPFHEFHDRMLQWYDHWLKGIDTGIMDEPPIKLFVEGIKQWRYENEWPLARTKWTEFYLRPRAQLLRDPEPLDAASVPPDGFYQPPPSVTDVVHRLKWTTPAMLEDMEVTGPAALYLHASIDTDDTNFIVRLFDVDPHGNKIQLTTGWLKASHRELDESKSKPWCPHHPHTRSVPVVPGEIVQYAIRVHSMSNVFRAGHRIELEISSLESLAEAAMSAGPPENFHLPSGRATTHKIYRDRTYPSHLLLPIIPRE